MKLNDRNEKQQILQKLKEKLLEIELEQRNGAKFYTLEKLDAALKQIVFRDFFSS